MSEGVFQGSLFSSDFLRESISRLLDWSHIDDAALEALRLDLRSIFDRFPTAQSPNESQTEDDLIWPVLARLGWTSSLRQQNLAPRGREDVPDGLLFKDDSAAQHNPQLPHLRFILVVLQIFGSHSCYYLF
jgi:hypothetical protein